MEIPIAESVYTNIIHEINNLHNCFKIVESVETTEEEKQDAKH